MIQIARLFKGMFTFGELENMPYWKFHTLFKEFYEWRKDEEAQNATQQEEMVDNIEDAMTGGM